MSLQVIGSGFGRTGTTSIKAALELLGYGPCHHATEVLANPRQIPVWQRALAGEAVDWADLMRGYRSQLDWPGAHFWRELAVAFPEARIIHTVRPPDKWWQSYSTTIGSLLHDRSKVALPAGLRAWFDDLEDMIGRQTFGSGVMDKDAGMAAFARRTDEVVAAIPAARLLVFDAAEGWEPLCAFLDVAVPDQPFPRLNSTAEFWDSVTAADPANRSLLRRLVNRLGLRRLARPHLGV